MLKRSLKIIGITLGAFIGLILLYIGAAFCLSRIPVNGDAVAKNDVTIYILSNGVHTDVVLPIKTACLFHTCNTWANNALKACGQKASLWTPFDTGIFYHYQK